ncbi:bifunctional riboflavin kinase/FAD synthetase [Chiayiivirga sp.]|jgi:riboflavin kinase/FMN adenylyltransferase|uniref:bifunctional riboflavin kinase/FAD synthetase n=1 Tax=Chiayiivirga sp. TaxID=2041042 RepID=UPI0031F32A32
MTRLFRDVEGETVCPRGSVVCIGAFDGLHLGHQALVRRAHARACELGLPAVALSFEPLPREYFSLASKPPRLLLPRARFEGLRSLGVDVVGLLRFNQALASMAANDFVERVLIQRLQAREIWVGPEFRFGRSRGGDLALLQSMGAIRGFAAHEIAPVLADDGERMSSSLIRAALVAGNLGQAAQWLGRPYAIAGKVVRGQQLGRKLGYPTANLRLANKIPALGGIYATRVHGPGDEVHASVSSLGTRPTVSGTDVLLEAHLFDFDGDLYGRRIEVEFVAKLRDEVKFDGLDALVAQMHVDAANARQVLAAEQASAPSGAEPLHPAVQRKASA